MCATCGCDTDGNVTMHEPGHHHDHNDHHSHDHQKKMVAVEKDVLNENNLLAERNRGYFEAKNILALNLVSSPGSGKTSLLERTLKDMKGELEFAVIEGDQQTTNDADRIHATGTKVVQINTGKGCHLDAHRVGHALETLNLADHSLLFIENVGNLVCPSAFDLGEAHKVVILSVTEGEDKPLKYPDMFHAADLMILKKIDLLPYLDFDLDQCIQYAKQVNPKIKILSLSAKTGAGMEEWLQWLKAELKLQLQP